MGTESLQSVFDRAFAGAQDAESARAHMSTHFDSALRRLERGQKETQA